MRQFAADFGLTPSARARVGAAVTSQSAADTAEEAEMTVRHTNEEA